MDLVGGLPVQHRLVQPSSQQVDADISDLVDPKRKTSSSNPGQSKPPSGPTMKPSSEALIEISHAGQRSPPR